VGQSRLMNFPQMNDLRELFSYLTPQEAAEMDRLLATPTDAALYPQYKDDPVGFGVDLLGEQYTDDVKAVMRSVRDYAVTIAESANAVGKTHSAARIAIWWYKTRPGAQVYTAAAPPERNLKQLLWGEIDGIATRHPKLFEGDKVNVLNIGRNKQEFVTGVTIPQNGTPAQREAAFSGKHAPYLLFILDEADAIPPEVFRAIESCMSGGKARLLCMYNPRSDEGPIAAMKSRGVNVVTLSAFNHPNVVTGKDIFPGAVTRNKTLSRTHKWTQPADIEGISGYGRFTVPDYLVGADGTDEETGKPLPPLPPGDRVIVEPEYAYMVLGIYPGQTRGVIYDTWLDDYDRAQREGWSPQGNVTDEADFIPDGGEVYWSIDDGYAGSIDHETGEFTADSHPRVIGFYQVRANGDIVRFDEIYRIREPRAEVQIGEAEDMPYPPPSFAVVGPGTAALGGLLTRLGYYKRSCMANVEESIKHMRDMISPDENGHRRFRVHPRCRHFRYEIARYRRDELGRVQKRYDHGPDEGRYLLWIGRNGF
jgi:hypothetical protein